MCFLNIFSIYSQEIIFTKEIEFNLIFKDTRKSFPVFNEKNGQLALFLFDSKTINGVLLNKSYVITEEMTTTRPDKKFEEILGYSIFNESYCLFFSNQAKNQLFVKTINFQTKKSSEKLISLNLKNEKFLESINYNNRFFILTIEKQSSILNIYEFINENELNEHEIDLSNFQFSRYSYSKLYNVIISAFPKIQKVQNNQIDPIEFSSKKNKLYLINNKMFITLDNQAENTKIVSVDLDNFNFSVKFFDQVRFKDSDTINIKTNSYLFNNVLYQFKISQNELCLTLHDLKTDSLLQRFKISAEDEIFFKNGPIVQEGGTTLLTSSSEKEIENTLTVLKKMMSSDIGMSAYEKGAYIELTIGAFKEVSRTSGSPMASSYTNTRLVYFKSLLDKSTLLHNEGLVTKNCVDKIKEYSENHKNEILPGIIIKQNDYYLYGYFMQLDNNYIIRKFVD